MTKRRFLYLSTRGQIFGPLAASRMLDMYKSGKIKADDMISADKVSWVSAPEFFEPKQNVPLKAVPEEKKPEEKKLEDKPVLIPVDSDRQKIIVRPASPGRTAGVFAMMFSLAAVFMVIICLCFEPPPVPEDDGTEYAEGKNAADGAFEQDGAADTENGVPQGDQGEFSAPQNEQKASAPSASGGKIQDIIRRNKHAVGVIIVRFTETNNKVHNIAIGTAWAIDERRFVTNAHVANGVKKQYQKLRNNPQVRKFEVVIGLNESGENCIVEGVKIHPEFAVNPNGSDFAELFVRDKVKNFLTCADKSELYALQQGDEIFYLGFPMEGLIGSNINVKRPTATMQHGRISSLSDIAFGSGIPEDNILIRHDLPAVGGASGSPIFSASGKVIGVLNAGNMNFKYDNYGRVLGREPSAAQVNFAIRIDRLDACRKINFTHARDFLER